MFHFLLVRSRGGYSFSVPNGSSAPSKLSEYRVMSGDFAVVSIGDRSRYAVVSSKGSYWNAFTDGGFGRKMKEISNSDIKQISFGNNKQWAIVMKNGWCHAYCNDYPNGPRCSIVEHNGNIKYVSMTANSGEWIVGWGRNGFKSRGCSTELTEYLTGVSDSHNHIFYCDLGRMNNRYVVHTSNGWKWRFEKIGSVFHDKMQKDDIKSVSIW